MLSQHAASPALQVGVLDDFAGERSEMLIAWAVFLVVAVDRQIDLSGERVFANL